MNRKNEQTDKIRQIIDSAQEILCVPHINPDGDAIGSSLGLALWLRERGRNVKIGWDSDLYIVPHYRFLPGLDLITDEKGIGAPDCIIVLDCGSRSRMGDFEKYVSGAKAIINIDHHEGNEMFGDINIVEPQASSVAEIIYRLLLAMEPTLSKEIVECLYTGVVTDTGRFQYKNTSANTHEIAADMIRRGVDPNYIYRRVFERSTFGAIKLLCMMLGRAVLDERLSLIFSWITEEDLKDTDTNFAETENFVDYLRAVGEPEVAAMVKREKQDSCKVSLRSKESFDVGALARKMGGGGHRHAAGYTTAESIEDTIANLKNGLEFEIDQS